MNSSVETREQEKVGEYLRNESGLLWQKFTAFLIATSFLIVAFATLLVGKQFMVAFMMSIVGFVITLLLWSIMRISWKYHDYLYRESDLSKIIQKGDDCRPQHVIRTRSLTTIIFVVFVLFWFATMILLGCVVGTGNTTCTITLSL